VTSVELPQLDADTRLLLAPLEKRGISVTPAVWDDTGVDWAAFDLAVIRSCWDYVPRREEFVRWAESVKRLANPAAVVAWNTDKRYLRDLAARGVPVVPTTWVEPDDGWDPPAGEWVVKPAVSISSRDTGRYRLDDPGDRELAWEHVRRLNREGRTVMLQPYLRDIEEDGETSLVYLGGAFSHAIRKGAMLDGPDRGVRHPHETSPGLEPRRPTDAQLSVAAQALAAVPPGGSGELLYARVDLVPGSDGNPRLMELELTEPTLYFARAPGAAERFADVIAERAASPVG
jgi:hypothetical protein